MNYYNEFDPFAAAWLRELIKEKLIPQGDVDERSITEIIPSELRGYTQCHFFAGIGGWSLALQLAGWPTDRPVWTGSCPCQPFSSAGKQKGKADERHLWPVWLDLIRECKPQTIFGEQVASSEVVGQELEIAFSVAVQRGDYAEANRIANKLVKLPNFAASSRWLDDVYQGLEAEGYACGAAVLPACSVGAPHKRDRLWFVANSKSNGRNKREQDSGGCNTGIQPRWSERPPNNGSGGNVVNTKHTGSHGVWIGCPDGKQRLIEPSIPLLAHGVPNRVGRLRGYGNAIVPQVAAEFIGAFMDTEFDVV